MQTKFKKDKLGRVLIPASTWDGYADGLAAGIQVVAEARADIAELVHEFWGRALDEMPDVEEQEERIAAVLSQIRERLKSAQSRMFQKHRIAVDEATRAAKPGRRGVRASNKRLPHQVETPNAILALGDDRYFHRPLPKKPGPKPDGMSTERLHKLLMGSRNSEETELDAILKILVAEKQAGGKNTSNAEAIRREAQAKQRALWRFRKGLRNSTSKPR